MDRRPVGEVLSGLSIDPFDDGETPVAGFFLVKVNDADGDDT